MSYPNFYIVGAAKSGTTSLYAYLSKHPEVFLPKQKELHYFSYDDLKQRASGPGDRQVISKLCSTERDYLRMYEGSDGFLAVGDVSPSYLFHTNAAARIRSVANNPKIVIILRNPADKAYSQYLHLKRNGRERLSFEAALRNEQQRAAKGWGDMFLYVSSGMYYSQVKTYLDVFGSNNVLIMLFEQFCSDTAAEMLRLCDFLGIDRTCDLRTSEVHNQGGGIQRFGFLGSAIMASSVLRRLFEASIPERSRYRLIKVLKEVLLLKAPKLSRSTRGLIIEGASEDVRRLERLIGCKTGWLDVYSRTNNKHDCSVDQ